MCFSSSDSPFPICFVVFEFPELEDHYQVRVQATLEFALTIEDFDDLVDPCHLYDCCLGPEPFAFVLKKIIQEEKSMLSMSSLFFFFLIEKLILLSNLLLVEMATSYSKDKYARMKGLKNEPCPILPLNQRNASWTKEKMKLLPPCLSLVLRLLPHLLLR